MNVCSFLYTNKDDKCPFYAMFTSFQCHVHVILYAMFLFYVSFPVCAIFHFYARCMFCLCHVMSCQCHIHARSMPCSFPVAKTHTFSRRFCNHAVQIVTVSMLVIIITPSVPEITIATLQFSVPEITSITLQSQKSLV